MKIKKVFVMMMAFVFAFVTLVGASPPQASAFPNVSHISALSGDFVGEPSVFMNGNRVSAQRYIAVIDGISYEAFCADPLLRGPQNAGAVYEIAGEASSALRNALRNGYPINSEWSGFEGNIDLKMYWAYVTRVAVAMANNPSRSFTGEASVLDQATRLANGSLSANHNAYPPIMVNGTKSTQDTGRTVLDAIAQSQAFNITYNRKTNLTYNPFRFEWAAGTPAGARLLVGGNVIATAPTNPTTIFRDNITSFQIEMPNTAAFAGRTASVNLVGIHNQFSDRVWLMQNPNDPNGWQDVVFYIPEVSASAAFSFETVFDEPTPEPTTPPTTTPPTFTPTVSTIGVRIQKIDALSRLNIPGALIRLRGMSSHQVITGDGQMYELDNTGINISQVLTAGAVTAAPGDVTSTVSDGVWELTGLPFGFYIAEEERAPENYSLLPQHTAYGFWLLPPNVNIEADADVQVIQCPETGAILHIDVDITYEITEGIGISSILLTFENYPFGEIEVTKYDEITGSPLADAHFRIQGFFAEGNTNGMPIDRVGVTGADGRIVFDNLPAGQYTISEVQAPPGYQLDSTVFRSIPLTWGQTASTSFYNRSHPNLEILKLDAVTKEPLTGATFRVQKTQNSTVSEYVTDGNGRIFIENLEEGVYSVVEIVAPDGYILVPERREIMLEAGTTKTLVFENILKPTLIFIKTNGLTGRGVYGATYRVEYEAPNGGIINLGSYVTRCGLIVLPHVQPGWYILTETRPAPGFALPSNPVQRVFLAPGQNSYTFAQTQVNLLIDPRTNPNSGSRGDGGDWCGYLCSRLCAGNCGNPGGGNTAGGAGGSFGNMTITNGNGDPLGTATQPLVPPEGDIASGGSPSNNGGIIFVNPDFPGITITFGK
jgi:hypothetical protein